MKTYEMTLSEYKESLRGQRIPHNYYNREGQIRAWHRDAVANALQLGWTIPIDVLQAFKKEYSHIARLYSLGGNR